LDRMEKENGKILITHHGKKPKLLISLSLPKRLNSVLVDFTSSSQERLKKGFVHSFYYRWSDFKPQQKPDGNVAIMIFSEKNLLRPSHRKGGKGIAFRAEGVSFMFRSLFLPRKAFVKFNLWAVFEGCFTRKEGERKSLC
jgi:hypothetical protein